MPDILPGRPSTSGCRSLADIIHFLGALATLVYRRALWVLRSLLSAMVFLMQAGLDALNVVILAEIS